MLPSPCRLAGLIACLSLSLPGSAPAASPQRPAPPQAEPPALSADDLKDIESALGKDAAQATASPAPARWASRKRKRNSIALKPISTSFA